MALGGLRSRALLTSHAWTSCDAQNLPAPKCRWCPNWETPDLIFLALDKAGGFLSHLNIHQKLTSTVTEGQGTQGVRLTHTEMQVQCEPM